jgi:hypothetical protein
MLRKSFLTMMTLMAFLWNLASFADDAPIASEVEEQYGVVTIGQTEEIRDHFYAISVERKITHPAVAAITDAARAWLSPQVNPDSAGRSNSKRSNKSLRTKISGR